jgi:hypothetical protein
VSKPTRILLYGNSLLVEGIGASLRTEGGFDLVQVSRTLPGVGDFQALDPEVIIFDIECPGYAAVFSAFEENPDLLLLGVSPDTNVVRVWSGRRYEELSVSDLAALLATGAHRTVAGTETRARRHKGKEV